MFKFIKTKLFGSKIFQRTASVNITSKYKAQNEQKRPLSIDSKPKLQSRHPQPQDDCPQVIQIDQHIDNHYPHHQTNNADHYDENISYIMVSQAGSYEHHKMHLALNQQPNLLQGLSQSLEEQRYLQPAINQTKKQLIPNYVQEAIMHQTITRNGKILVKRSPEKKPIKKIQQRCSICKKALNYSDSIQLACTHRCHKACSVKMQWRMKYTCDLCQSRNEMKNISRHK